MPELTVFLAPAGPAASVLDALVDLSGAGLVDPFVWVTDGGEQQTSGVHVATEVVGGRRIPTTLQGTVADSESQRARFCVLVPLLAGARTVAGDVEQELREIVAFRANRRLQVTPVRCLLAPPSGVGSVDAAARDGWHNVLVAPEDSKGPDSGLAR